MYDFQSLIMLIKFQIIRASETTEDDLKKRVDSHKNLVDTIDVQVTNKENTLVKRANLVNSYNEKVKTIQEVSQYSASFQLYQKEIFLNNLE